MKLNPLIKIENLDQNKCLVTLLIDKKKFEVNKNLFTIFLDNYKNGFTRENIELNIADNLKVDKEKITYFIETLFDKKILLQNTDGYPVDQINHWTKRKWLNALIYHLESQNITCIDDGNSIKEVEGDTAIAFMIILHKFNIFSPSEKIINIDIMAIAELSELILSDIYKYEYLANEKNKFNSTSEIFSKFIRNKYFKMSNEVYDFLESNSVRNCNYYLNFVSYN